MGFFRRKVAESAANKINRVYFGEVKRLEPVGYVPKVGDVESVRQVHRLAWDVVVRDVFRGRPPALALKDATTAQGI